MTTADDVHTIEVVVRRVAVALVWGDDGRRVCDECRLNWWLTSSLCSSLVMPRRLATSDALPLRRLSRVGNSGIGLNFLCAQLPHMLVLGEHSWPASFRPRDGQSARWLPSSSPVVPSSKCPTDISTDIEPVDTGARPAISGAKKSMLRKDFFVLKDFRFTSWFPFKKTKDANGARMTTHVQLFEDADEKTFCCSKADE